jgi:hypothetical protein
LSGAWVVGDAFGDGIFRVLQAPTRELIRITTVKSLYSLVMVNPP